MTEEEEAKIQHFFENQPEIEVTPQFLAQVIAKFVETTQNLSPQSSPEKVEEMLSSSEDERGREGDADRHTRHGVSSRSSSSGRSTGSHRSSGSAPNFPPRTPLSSPPSDSPFETGKRQRTAPLQHVPPSSWSSRKAVPIQRRKSDADVVGRDLSDSEVRVPCFRGSHKANVDSSHPSIDELSIVVYALRLSTSVFPLGFWIAWTISSNISFGRPRQLVDEFVFTSRNKLTPYATTLSLSIPRTLRSWQQHLFQIPTIQPRGIRSFSFGTHGFTRS